MVPSPGFDPGSPALQAGAFTRLAYHPNFVAKAMGSTDVFITEQVAEYYGSIVSAMQLFGASKMRTTQTGVVAIVQA